MRSSLLGLALAVMLLGSGCADDAPSDDVVQVCTDSCQTAFECELETVSNSEEECLDACIPRLTRQRARCPEFFDLKRCFSRLTCEEKMQHAEIIYQANGKIEYEADYPCKAELLADREKCS